MTTIHKPYAHFSPSLLCVSYNVSHTPELDAALPANLTVLPGWTPEQQWNLVSRYAASIHEYRHFYDWIGTPLGVILFDCLQRRTNEYLIRLTPQLFQVDELNLPLITRFASSSGPVQDFLVNYCFNTFRYARLMCNFDIPNGYEGDNLVSEFVPPFSPDSASVPVINISKLGAWQESSSSLCDKSPYMAFGGKQIVECLGYLAEWECVRNAFPHQESNLKESVRGSEERWTYTLPLCLMEEYLGQVSIDLVMAACEFAMCVPENPSSSREGQPGWRFISLLHELSKNELRAGFDEAANRVCLRNKWVEPLEAIRQTFRYTTAQIEHNSKNPEGSLVKSYNLLYYQLAQRMVGHYAEVGFPHKSIQQYFEDIDSDERPQPP